MAIPSFDDLYAAGLAELQLLRPDLFVNEGDVSDAMLSAAAAMGDKVAQATAEALRKTFIGSATANDLSTLVNDRYGLIRVPATSSVGVVSFTRSSGPLLAGTIAAGTIVGTAFDSESNRVEFATQTDVDWLLAETGTKQVVAVASVTGTDGNIGALEVTTAVSTIFDNTIAVSNPAAFAGGNLQESDEELRTRARAFPSTLRRGTLAALEFGALTVPSVAVATAVQDATSGLVSVYVTDSTGASNVQMLEQVDTELVNWVCAGTTASAVAGLLFPVNVTVNITARAGFDVAALRPTIIDAITGAMAKLKIGETLFHTIIESAALSVSTGDIIGVTVTSPASTTVPSANQLIRAGVVTVN